MQAGHETSRRLTPDTRLQVFAGHDFGGCSVTIPHKEAVLPHVHDVTDSARAIGAVNTVVRQACGKLLGDNTGM